MKSGKQQEGVYIHIPIRPVPKGRPRRARNGGMFTDPKTRAFERDVAFYGRDAMALRGMMPIEGPIRAEVILEDDEVGVYIEPIDVEKSKLRGDADNYAKAVLDALNGIAFMDDRQIQELKVVKA